MVFQAYKYKEQLLEAQLKKELAEKKRQEGKLTPQQEKAKKEELLVEKVMFWKLGEEINCCCKLHFSEMVQFFRKLKKK